MSMTERLTERLLSIDEVLAQLRTILPTFARSTLYGLIERGEIATLKIGHRRLFPPYAVTQFLEQQLVAEKTRIEAARQGESTGQLVKVSQDDTQRRPGRQQGRG